MKRLVVLGLCLLSSLASAKEIEEVVVVARQVKVILINIKETHRFNPITQKWYYDAALERDFMDRHDKKQNEQGGQ